jgi:glycosyltransferase involved in cell wall biosynthesis
MKRILLIVPSNKGTMAIRALDLQDALLKEGHEVSVAIMNKKIADGHRFKFVTFYSSNDNVVVKNIIRLFWLRRIKKNFRPDISISVLNCCSRVSVLSGGKDIKIGQFRAPVEQKAGKINDILDRLSFYLFFGRLDKLYCVSKEVENSIRRNFKHIKDEKIETVNNLFNKGKIIELSAYKTSVEIDLSSFTFASVGRIEKIKGQERIIRALSMFPAPLRKRVKLIFIGETNITYNNKNYYQFLLDLIKELELEEQVLFLGHQDNPYSYLAKSDCFILSSYEEGLPGALIEALILKKPVVSTNCSLGVWEIMDAQDQYDDALDTWLKTDCGYITSNLSKTKDNELNKGKDISNLSHVMRMVMDNPSDSSYTWTNKFDAKDIIDKFVNPL